MNVDIKDKREEYAVLLLLGLKKKFTTFLIGSFRQLKDLYCERKPQLMVTIVDDKTLLFSLPFLELALYLLQLTSCSVG